MTVAPVRVGLVGAGPWARFFHAPLLMSGPETALAGVWSRSNDHARELAARFGDVPVLPSFDALVDACEAIALCVAPDAQVEYGVRAAEAGKPLLLEKPLA